MSRDDLIAELTKLPPGEFAALRERMRHPERRDHLAEWLARGIRAQRAIDAARAGAPGVCRVCGCTDADCSACVARTGEPCSWADAAHTLCSACAFPRLHVDAPGGPSFEVSR